MASRVERARTFLAAFIVSFFFLFYLAMGIREEKHDQSVLKSAEALITEGGFPTLAPPNFENYTHSKTLQDVNLSDGNSVYKRIIIIGDVHGMKSAFEQLMKKARYDPTQDLLIHVGDILAKGKLKGSMSVLAYMTSNNITGVRGNHDQVVVEWRGWINWVLSQSFGSKWLEEMESMSKKELKQYIKKSQGKGWKTIPKGWDMLSEHYSIARSMTEEQYKYLITLPLIIHMPHLHTFVAHAGLLPMNPSLSTTSPHQPLSHVPSLPGKASGDVTELRRLQEAAIISNVSQNVDPWIVLNMRSISNNNEITKDNKKGHPWSELWNSVVNRCAGFEVQTNEADLKKSKLPCYSSTVVYGHAAKRGLDIKRWTKGLDSACVYGKQLTALVLTAKDSLADDIDSQSISYDDDRLKARLVQVKC